MEQPTTAYEDILGLRIGIWDADKELEPHLTFIGDADLSEPDYSFNLLRFYVRKRDGAVLYATDAGCSCPSPFEDVTVGELKETTLDKIEDVARTAHAEEYGGVALATLLQEVRGLVPAMREAGAK